MLITGRDAVSKDQLRQILEPIAELLQPIPDPRSARPPGLRGRAPQAALFGGLSGVTADARMLSSPCILPCHSDPARKDRSSCKARQGVWEVIRRSRPQQSVYPPSHRPRAMSMTGAAMPLRPCACLVTVTAASACAPMSRRASSCFYGEDSVSAMVGAARAFARLTQPRVGAVHVPEAIRRIQLKARLTQRWLDALLPRLEASRPGSC